MKALKREAKILKKGDSKVTSRQKDRHKIGLSKRGFWTALNSLTGEEIFQKTRLSPGGKKRGLRDMFLLRSRSKQHDYEI